MEANEDVEASQLTSASLQTLLKRRDFLAVARGSHKAKSAFVLQARQRPNAAQHSPPRIGITCSKKVGNAVARNRAKRRLREAARNVLPQLGRTGWDYVLIGRRNTTESIEFGRLLTDLQIAVEYVHRRQNIHERKG
ncbi:MAG: ribonuclease P protein component [Pseudomonadota bacterium]